MDKNKVQFLADGSVKVDGAKLTEDQVARLLRAVLTTGSAGRYFAAGGPGDLPGACAQLVASQAEGDWNATIDALAGVLRTIGQAAGVRDAPAVEEGGAGRAEELPPVVRQAGRLVARFPLESHNARRDNGEAEEAASQLGVQMRLRDVLGSSAATATRSVWALAQREDAWVRRLLSAVAPAEAGNEALRAAAAPLHAYVDRLVARAAVTKRLLDRARQETAQTVEAEVHDQALRAAREEIRGKLDERMLRALEDHE